MPVNDFKAFATGEFANVLSQPEFEELEALGNGFQAGIARSEELNKVWRQASTIASVVASFMATKSGNDVLDNGDVTTLQATLLKALLNNSTSQLDGRYLKAASNLSELSNAASARGNLGLKGAAVQDVGTTSGTVAAGNDTRIVNALQKGNNLSEIKLSGGNAQEAARTNLGLGTAATANVQVSKDDVTGGRVMVNGGALALRSVLAGPGKQVTDFNNLPQNSVSFGYEAATNSPGFTGSIIDFSGSNGGYNAQIATQYNGNGSRIAFRTRNGDSAGAWNSWGELYHTKNKPKAIDTGALPIDGGTLKGPLTLSNGIALYPETASMNKAEGLTGTYATETLDYRWELYARSKASAGIRSNIFTVDITDISKGSTASGGGANATTAITLHGRVVATSTIEPRVWTNFDARYQSKGNYTPAGQAYTKAESDTRYNLKNTATKSANSLVTKDSSTGVMEIMMSNITVSNNSTVNVTFPTAFPNVCVGVVISYDGTGHGKDSDSSIAVPSYSRTGCTLRTVNSNGKFTLIAKGY